MQETWPHHRLPSKVSHCKRQEQVPFGLYDTNKRRSDFVEGKISTQGNQVRIRQLFVVRLFWFSWPSYVRKFVFDGDQDITINASLNLPNNASLKPLDNTLVIWILPWCATYIQYVHLEASKTGEHKVKNQRKERQNINTPILICPRSWCDQNNYHTFTVVLVWIVFHSCRRSWSWLGHLLPFSRQRLATVRRLQYICISSFIT